MQKIYLWDDETVMGSRGRPSLDVRLCEGKKSAPAVLVIPGGGYGCVCESTEGTPIARKFNELGYHAFVLDYRTAPSRWPAPQLDAMRAVKLIRANAEKWGVIADQVAACGFSAGAHLAGSLGILCDGLDASNGDEADRASHVPDVLLLCYGVLSFAPWSHIGTQQNLLGEENMACAGEYSLPEKVTADTPPAFLMHTICDQVVPYRNSMEFAGAMAAHRRPCELMLYYWGDHGMLLGNDTSDVCRWPEAADGFMKSLWKSRNDPEFLKRYTNKYQAESNS